MLRPATLVDLPILRALIRDGAVAGDFDRQLATDSPHATLFFASLRRALATGYAVEKDPASGELVTLAAPGYVYTAAGDDNSHRPIGFGLFRAAGAGYELWLAGVDPGPRGRGHGPALLAELLKTPPGHDAYVVRLGTAGREIPAMAQQLLSSGYARVRETLQTAWYLRNDAPEAIGRRLPARGTRPALR